MTRSQIGRCVILVLDMGDLQETLQPELIQISVVNKYSYPVLGGPNSSCEITRELDIQDLISRYVIQNISIDYDICIQTHIDP